MDEKSEEEYEKLKEEKKPVSAKKPKKEVKRTPTVSWQTNKAVLLSCRICLIY